MVLATSTPSASCLCRHRQLPAGAQPHGYALAGQTGLKSGTLYPILIRLAERGLVEACWQDEPVPGRPRRHLYRLTADGLASATAALSAAAEAAVAQATAPRAARPARRSRPGPAARRLGSAAQGRRGATAPGLS